MDKDRPVPNTRIALAGLGAWGMMHARAIDAIEGAQVVAVLAPSAPAQTAAAQALPHAKLYTDYDAMLANPDIDVVNIALPNDAHASAAIAALGAGKHVFLEKPLGLTLEQCNAVCVASARTGRQVVVNHELRVSRQWGRVHEIVAKGELGALRHQHLSLFRKPFRTGSGGWRYDKGRVGSWVLEELVHFIDLVLWYGQSGGMPVRVTAYGGDPETGLSDYFSVVLEWESGASAVLNQCLGGFEHHTLLEIAGSGGALRTWWSGAMDRSQHPSFDLKYRVGENDAVQVAIPLSGEVFELEENLRQAFIGFAEGRSIMPPSTARLSVEVCLAAERSWQESRPMALSLKLAD